MSTIRTMQPAGLEEFGVGVLAYIRTCTDTQARKLFPTAAALEKGAQYYALFEADGTPLLLADSRDIAIGCAFSYDLRITPLH